MEQITVLAAEFDRRGERIEELTEKLRLSGIRERSYRDQLNAAQEALQQIWDSGGESHLAYIAGDALGITDA